MANPNMERWRVLTPIILALLSCLVSLNVWILQDLRASITNTGNLVRGHIDDHSIHSDLRKDMEWIKQTLQKGTFTWASRPG